MIQYICTYFSRQRCLSTSIRIVHNDGMYVFFHTCMYVFFMYVCMYVWVHSKVRGGGKKATAAIVIPRCNNDRSQVLLPRAIRCCTQSLGLEFAFSKFGCVRKGCFFFFGWVSFFVEQRRRKKKIRQQSNIRTHSSIARCRTTAATECRFSQKC